MGYRLEWYSVFHCSELLIERLHNESGVCPNPRVTIRIFFNLKNLDKMLWSHTESLLEVYMIHRTAILKEASTRRIPVQIDTFVEAATVIIISSLLAEPNISVKDIMTNVSVFINRDQKYVAAFCDLAIFYLIK